MSGLNHGWDGDERPNHADFVHGGVSVSDFDEEIRPRHSKRSRKKEKKKYPGCPANGGKGHVFVWTFEFEDTKNLFYRFFGYHKYERKACCGCGHRDATRLSERYRARKEKEWAKGLSSFSTYLWWSWEDEVEEYRAFRSNYIARHGFNEAVYDW